MDMKKNKIYFQPDLDDNRVCLYSFEVYHFLSNARRDYPNVKILAYADDDIENPVYIDDDIDEEHNDKG